MAETARVQAKDTAKLAQAKQQYLAAISSIKRAEEDLEKTEPLVPEARSGALETKKYAMLARQHMDHAKQVAKDFALIPKIATEQSNLALEGWIRGEATKSAVSAAVTDPAEAAKIKENKLAAAVAAAVEPYHLALLRNQKYATEVYAKAKSAGTSSQKLQDSAKALALKAQDLQAAGLGVNARAMMMEAHSMISEAENLRQWSVKLYNQANTAETSAGGYVLSESQAAANAAATTVINPPMKLPPAAS